MAKKGPLTKIEAFYVEQNNKLGKDTQSIADDLNRPLSSIENYIAKYLTPKKNTKLALAAGEHFNRQKGVTIMTETASSIGDAHRKKTKDLSRPSCITTIKSVENDNDS
jgi:hypothetical protein